jgi:hypothetical protein
MCNSDLPTFHPGKTLVSCYQIPKGDALLATTSVLQQISPHSMRNLCPSWVILYWKPRCISSLIVEETEPLYAFFFCESKCYFLGSRKFAFVIISENRFVRNNFYKSYMSVALFRMFVCFLGNRNMFSIPSSFFPFCGRNLSGHKSLKLQTFRKTYIFFILCNIEIWTKNSLKVNKIFYTYTKEQIVRLKIFCD